LKFSLFVFIVLMLGCSSSKVKEMEAIHDNLEDLNYRMLRLEVRMDTLTYKALYGPYSPFNKDYK